MKLIAVSGLLLLLTILLSSCDSNPLSYDNAISVSNDSIEITDLQRGRSVEIVNKKDFPLTWWDTRLARLSSPNPLVYAETSDSWLSVFPVDRNLIIRAGESADIMITVLPTGLDPGAYTGTVTFLVEDIPQATVEVTVEIGG